MEGASSMMSMMELERNRGGGNRVRSNSSLHQMAIYGGIGVAGVAAGAAVAVAQDPIYDREKKLRGKEVTRKMEWDSDFTDFNLEGVDKEMYDFHKSNGQMREASKIEARARDNFNKHSYDHQVGLVKKYTNPLPEIKGSFRARMTRSAKNVVNKVARL